MTTEKTYSHALMTALAGLAFVTGKRRTVIPAKAGIFVKDPERFPPSRE